MLLHRFFLWLTAILVIAAGAYPARAQAQNGAKPAVHTEQVSATLLAHAPQGVPVGVAPEAAQGQPVWVGLQIEHAPHWHTYWKNSGDSGLPTELEWQLPAGLDAGEIAWPLPRKIPIGTLANYGYEGTVLLPVPVTVASTFAPGQYCACSSAMVNGPCAAATAATDASIASRRGGDSDSPR